MDSSLNAGNVRPSGMGIIFSFFDINVWNINGIHYMHSNRPFFRVSIRIRYRLSNRGTYRVEYRVALRDGQESSLQTWKVELRTELL